MHSWNSPVSGSEFKVSRYSDFFNSKPETRNLFCVVDLCLLQLTGIVDVNRFPLAEDVIHGRAGLAMAVAGILHATEGKMDFSPNGGTVDVGDSRLDVSHRAKGAGYVVRVYRTGEAISGAVENFDRFFKTLHFDDGQDRAEYLLLSDAHGRSHLIEDRWPIEVIVNPLAGFIDLAAGEKPRAFLFTDLHIAMHLFARRMIDQRPYLDAFVEAVADLDLLGPRDEHIRQFRLDVSMKNQPTRRRAALASGAEGTPQRAFQG